MPNTHQTVHLVSDCFWDISISDVSGNMGVAHPKNVMKVFVLWKFFKESVRFMEIKPFR
jgi:hypothetical protein